MGYFSSGTEGMDYQERYCLRCVNYRDLNDGRGAGCPVWDAHLVFNGEPHDELLSMLIPRSPDGIGNEECRMFLPVSTEAS